MAARVALRAEEDAVLLEIQAAVKSRKKTKKWTPDLTWIFQQCTMSGTRRTELFQLYDGRGKVSFLEKQTYRQWKSLNEFQRLAHPRRRRNTTFSFFPLVHSSSANQIDASVLSRLKAFCEVYFLGMNVEVCSSLDLVEVKHLTSRVHADTQREQFLVGDILSHLKLCRPRKAYAVVGITMVDLYPAPEWNFVLGHASLTDGSAVISFGRYFTDLAASGMLDIAQQLQNIWILLRVLTHEICHTFGMKHCYYFRCAMNESSSIQQAVVQPLFLCPICLRKLKKALKFDVVDRYQRMLEVCKELYQELVDSYKLSTRQSHVVGCCIVRRDTDTAHCKDGDWDSEEHSPTCDAGAGPVNCSHCKFPSYTSEFPLSPAKLTATSIISSVNNPLECGTASSLPSSHKSMANGRKHTSPEDAFTRSVSQCSIEQSHELPDDPTSPEYQLHLFHEAITWLEQSILDVTRHSQQYRDDSSV